MGCSIGARTTGIERRHLAVITWDDGFCAQPRNGFRPWADRGDNQGATPSNLTSLLEAEMYRVCELSLGGTRPENQAQEQLAIVLKFNRVAALLESMAQLNRALRERGLGEAHRTRLVDALVDQSALVASTLAEIERDAKTAPPVPAPKQTGKEGDQISAIRSPAAPR